MNHLTDKLLLQVRSIILLSQGQDITEDKPDKDKEAIFFGKLRECLQAGHIRFNSTYKEEIEKRIKLEGSVYEQLRIFK